MLLNTLPSRDRRFGLSAPVDATPSDLLTRLHYAFGGELGLSSDRARQGEREVLLRNSDALVRGSIRLTPGKRWNVCMYADMGAADSVLKWQGLAAIRSSNGLDLLGGWSAYSSEVAAICAAGLTQALSASEIEPLFALSFALDQLRSNLSDLERSVREWKTV